MPDSSRQPDTVVAETAAVIVGRLHDKLGDISGAIQHLVSTEIPELSGDAELLQLLRDTAGASVDAFFSAIRLGNPVQHVEPPTSALEYAQRLAQREISVNALMRAYRLGHRAALRTMIDEIRSAGLDPELSLTVYDILEAESFDYVDQISQQLVAVYEVEHDRWLENRNNLRAVQVRELLAGGDVDADAMTTALRYPLARHHLAVVAWCRESSECAGPVAMERFVHRLGESLGARDGSLFIAVDRVTGWAWIPLSKGAAADSVGRARDFIESQEDGPRVALGRPLPGVAGFRRSHEQAQDARTVALAAGADGRRVTAVSDPGLAVAALLGEDSRGAAVLVGEVLGPLASDAEGDERLRETLRVFLRLGSSYTAAADELHLHHNSVKYRVQRAIERRGRPITDDRLDVEVALLLCKWFGSAVLT